MTARLIETTELPIRNIDTTGRLRPISELNVTSLMASIEEIGLQSEIHVRRIRHQGGKLRLIAGGHRLEAVSRLGCTSIAAKVWDCTDDWATLSEIDDKLAHADLGALDLSIFLAQRKEVYARMYPEANPRTPRAPRASLRGGGRSKITDAQREQKAVDDLIASLKEQRDIIAETDPVQKEMIQNRKVLAKATDAERNTVEELIAEEAAIERATERADFFGEIASNSLNSLIRDGEGLDDVLKNIAGSFLDAGIQAALFGKGPFGDFFGGSSITSMLFGTTAPQALATGGMIYGAGGSRDDKVPVLGSAGEFIVNASATARNRALLEAINSGAPVQALAAGGVIGGAPSTRAGASGPGNEPVVINVNVSGARGNAEIMEMVQEGVRLGVEEWDRQVLPGRFAEISDNPRQVG